MNHTTYDDYYQMLSDSVRMDAYQKAIQSVVKPGDVVVDLGAGTGILGFLAIKAGASKVFAIEKSDALELAKEIATKNNVQDKMEFLLGNSKQIELPEKADVLLSETLGSFGLDENTLDFTIDARNRFLKPNGIILPQNVKMFLVPIESADIYKKLSFWKNIKGVDYSPAFQVFSRKLMIETILPGHVLGYPQVFGDINFQTASNTIFENTVRLQVGSPGVIHGIGGWFELNLTDSITINTAPDKPPTHWKQAFFPIREPISVVPEDILEVTMKIRPKEKDSDDTQIEYNYRCTQLANEKSANGNLTGRNDPCPCGSGRKFKKCCG